MTQCLCRGVAAICGSADHLNQSITSLVDGLLTA